ncbi:MAG: DUF87 domain-containing protein, partial [Patescibacteria group bacterium]
MAFQPIRPTTTHGLTPSELEKQRIAAAQIQDEKTAIAEELRYRKGLRNIWDLIAPAAFEVQSNYVRVGSAYARTIFVVGYPRYLSVGWFSSIINFSATFDIALHFSPMPAQFILKQLKDKVGRIEAEIAMGQEKGKARDPMAETAIADVEKLRDDLTQGTEHFFSVGMYMTLYGSTLDELNKLTEDMEGLYASKLVYTKRVLYQAEQGFNSTIPLGDDELSIPFNMNTSPAAASFPFVSSDLTSDTGIMYGINRHNNSLIIFDRFSMPNANSVVFATSGAGKSYAIKLEVLRSMMIGTDVIVIDPEREYQHLCEAVGGTYINISLSSTARINPFDLPRPVGKSISVED